jgi:integrase
MAKAVKRLRADNLPIEPGEHADGDGLYLQVRRGAGDQLSRSWIFRTKVGGRERELGLGSVERVSLAEARKKAVGARKLRDDGVNPVAAKRAQQAAERLEAARAVTFDECAAEYIDSRPKWSQRYRDEWKASLDRYASPVIGGLPVGMIDTALVLKILRPIWNTKNRTASLVRDRLQAVLDAATVEGRRQGTNPARWKGHLDKLLAEKHSAQNFAAMSFAVVPAFMTTLRARVDTAAKALEFCILTASRSDGVIGAKWSEIDLGAKVWTVPKHRMKARREHRVPLSTRAIAILNDMAQRKENDAVFPGDRAVHLNAKAMRNLLCELLPEGQHVESGHDN